MGSINYNIAFAYQDDKQKNDFKYKDIDAIIAPDQIGRDINALFDAECVLNSLRNIFSWRKGERILNQEFGNPLLHFIDEPISEVTARNIASSIMRAFEQWEPRAKIVNLAINPYPDENLYYIEIAYSIPSIDDETIFNLNVNFNTEN